MFACIHFVVTFGLFFYGFDLSAIDGIESPRSKVLAMTVVQTLMLPGYLLWTPWASKNLPNAFQWLLEISNSLLWGVFIAAVAVGISARRSRSKN